MATFRSPAVALMPDVTPKPLRSQANAVINLMGSLGGILILVVGKILGTGKASNALMNYVPMFAITSAIIKPEVIANGTLFLRTLTPFYVICCFNQIYAGALRGAGNSRDCMFIMLGSFVLFRQIYLFAMARICNEVIPIAMSYPAGWILCSLITIIYYRKTSLVKNRLVEDA